MIFKIVASIIFLYSSLVLASINYHGRIFNSSSGNSLISSNVRFNVKIKAGSSCVVYEENHDNINMSGSNGYFSHNIGEGSVVFGNFDNSMKIDGTSVSCFGAGNISLTSSVSKSIDVQILEYDGSFYSINIAQILGLELKDVPVAIEAKSLNGKTASNFIQVSGVITQSSLNDLVSGSSGLYVLNSDLSSSVSSLTSGKLNSSSNLSDLTSASSARTNLGLGNLAILSSVPVGQIIGLGSLATLNSVSTAQVTGLGSLATLSSVGNSQITDVAYSKITGLPSSFSPSVHSHVISDVTNLQTSLDAKLTASKLSLNCASTQTVQYISINDSYQCQSIGITSSQVSGLGSLATLSSVGDAQITSLSGSKLTGGVQVGTVSGTTCTNAGLTRYNSGVLEVCDGSSWVNSSASVALTSTIITNALGYTPLNPANNLSGLANIATARTNLGLGSLATLSSVPVAQVTGLGSLSTLSTVGSSQITDLVYSKLTGVPASFTPSAHSHAISDVTNLQTSLTTLQANINTKLTASKLSLDCAAAQTVQYISATDSYQCQSIGITSSQVSGLGSLATLSAVPVAQVTGLGTLATLSSVGDSQITSLSGSKLTGPVQVGTVAGTTCISAGLTRYNSGVLEVCDGSSWVNPSASVALTSSAVTTALGYTPLNPANNLSGLSSNATARINLGLGSLATLSSVGNTQITDLAYSKLTGVPTTFSPSSHSHAISDITNLQTQLTTLQNNINLKLGLSQLSLNCSASQTVQYVSVSDSYQCQSIAINSSQISGLGTAATLNVGTSANQIVQLDAIGKIPASTVPTNVLTTSTTFSGDISGTNSTVIVNKIKNIPVSATAPSAGQVLVYDGAQWIPASGLPVYSRKTSDQSYSTTTLTNDTLAFNVTANLNYKFKFMILYTSAATSTGLKIGLNYPAVNTGSAFATVSLGADGTGAYFSGVINSSGDSVTATGTPTATPIVNIAIIEGIIEPSASGTVQLRVASEVNASNVVVKAGSIVEYTLIP